ncbi:MAG TPA: Wzz/FepE/Etk N-terminal domain-containing protein [Candidatus Acidoferrales bacterium]|nr:Wzz/FepE/Etk N-terminal domain-containing protein [Candidatus Acidoferrales bacterium]
MIERELTPSDYLSMFRRRWVLILVLTVVGGPLAYAVSFLVPVKYDSQTLVLVQQPTVPTSYVSPVDNTGISERLASMQQQILSRARLEPIIRRLGLFSKDLDKVPMDDLVARLQDAIEVKAVQPMAETKATSLPGFSVTVTLDNPQTAQQVCTAVTSLFIEQNLQLRQEHSEDTTEFLTQQLNDAKAQLDAQDAKLAAFQSHYLGTLPEDAQTNLSILSSLNSQLQSVTQAQSGTQQARSFTDSMLSEQLALWHRSQSDQNPESLREQLSTLQSQLAELKVKYTDDYPDVIKAKNDIAALRERIATSEQTATTPAKPQAAGTVEPLQIAQLRAQLKGYDQTLALQDKEQEKIKETIKLYQARVQSSPAIEQQYKELTRGYQTALDSYNDLLKKRDAAAMATSLERQQRSEQFTVLDPANLPDTPSFPNRPKFALGGVAGGLFAGFGLALLLGLRDTSMRTERDVELSLRLPVLCVIPSVDPLSLKEGNSARQLPPERLELTLRN